MIRRVEERVIKLVCVAKHEEKGTDVNLASHLLWDAFRGEFKRRRYLPPITIFRSPSVSWQRS